MLTTPRAIVLVGVLAVAAFGVSLAFPRYEVRVVSGRPVVRVDRWTGAVAYVVPERPQPAEPELSLVPSDVVQPAVAPQPDWLAVTAQVLPRLVGAGLGWALVIWIGLATWRRATRHS